MSNLFAKRGLPRQIKVDNGRPFGDPQGQGLPILALWLIGTGVDVIWNRPRTPQDNAKVERSQGTLGRWTEYEKTSSTNELQCVLQREANFSNYVFRDRRQGNTTRKERHPDMDQTGRRYKNENFDPQRIANFVAKGSWQRRVSRWGRISIGGKRFNVGIAQADKSVSLTFDATRKCWVAALNDGTVIGRSSDELWEEWLREIKGLT